MYRVRSRSGLSAYPGDCFFDPNRPSWLPFWIDTPTESNAKAACLYGSIPIVGGIFNPGGVRAQQIINPATEYAPPTPMIQRPTPPPGALDTQTGAVTDTAAQAATLPGTLAVEAAQRAQSGLQDFYNRLAQQIYPAGAGDGGGFSTLALIALGLAAGAGVLLLTSGGRGRRR